MLKIEGKNRLQEPKTEMDYILQNNSQKFIVILIEENENCSFYQSLKKYLYDNCESLNKKTEVEEEPQNKHLSGIYLYNGFRIMLIRKCNNENSEKNGLNISQLEAKIPLVRVLQCADELTEDGLANFKDSSGNSYKDLNSRNNSSHLMLLITDWKNPDSFEYGFNGGGKYLDHFWDVLGGNENIQKSKKNISNQFGKVSCTLVPSPESESIESKQSYLDIFNYLLNKNLLDNVATSGQELSDALKLSFPNNELKNQNSLFERSNLSNQNMLEEKNYGSEDRGHHSHCTLKPIESEDDSSDDDSVEEFGFSSRAFTSAPSRHCVQRSSYLRSNLSSIRTKFSVNTKHTPLTLLALPEVVTEEILKYLDDNDKLNFIFSSNILVRMTNPRNYRMILICSNYHQRLIDIKQNQIQVEKLTIDLQNLLNLDDFISHFNEISQESIVNLIIKNGNFDNSKQLLALFRNMLRLETLHFEMCSVIFLGRDVFPQRYSLSTISFKNCDENIFDAFADQKSIVNITFQDDNWNSFSFPHETLSKMAKSSEKMLKQIVLIGDRAGNFYDYNVDYQLPKLEKFETTTVKLRRSGGYRPEAISFLKNQIGHFKELIIHQLPDDFDGGKVIKFIIEKMNLDKFCYGKIPLILDRQKQELKELEVNEIQLTTALEMLRQFPSISKFCLNLTQTDIQRDQIEKIIQSSTGLFNSLDEFKIIDSHNGIFEVFAELLRYMPNLKKLVLQKQDGEINKILKNYLSFIPCIEEIYLKSDIRNLAETLNTIKENLPDLKKIFVRHKYFKVAKKVFGHDVTVIWN